MNYKVAERIEKLESLLEEMVELFDITEEDPVLVADSDEILYIITRVHDFLNKVEDDDDDEKDLF